MTCESRYVIAVDFDGTLCADCWPSIGKPDKDVIGAVREASQSPHVAVILWTCREGKELDDAVQACIEWGIKLSAVNANIPERIRLYGGDTRKISADLYIDDKSLFPRQVPLSKEFGRTI